MARTVWGREQHGESITEERQMAQSTPAPTAEQWSERLHAWAVEQWGEERTRAIEQEIDATAEHLAMVSEYHLAMEQIPAFFFTDV
jgi:hypothetical protein